MRIACLSAPERGQTNKLLSALAERLRARGIGLVGTVQTDIECAPEGRCDMDVTVLPEGPVIRISQSLGPNARGCRLDAAELEQAAALTEERLARDEAQLAIINKFGRHEAEEGRGFRTAMAMALERGLPVIVGVNPTNRAALEDFCGGALEALPPELDALEAWALANV